MYKPLTGKTLRLFHVDDDEDDRFLLARAIRTAGLPIDVQNASDGKEALTMLRTAAVVPDVLLLDIKMPEMSGFDVLEEIKRDARDPLVVMYSNSNQDRDVERARALGAHAYCVKPPRLEQLVEFVQRLYQSWLRSERPCEWPTGTSPQKPTC